jgi:transcription elongation factor B subunit 1
MHSGVVVQKVVEYLAHKAQFQGAKASEDIPDFIERIPPEIALEV